MPHQLDFRLLGPLEVRDDGRSLALGGRKQRSLLAILLLHANEAVSDDLLTDGLWGERPPKTAGPLQVHVSALRKLLSAERLERRAPGYLLHLEPEELDLARFERLCAEARGQEPEAAAATLAEALALWRGPPLADFAYDYFAQGEIARLEELRLGAIEQRIEAELALGRHAELVGELEALVGEHPLRERLREQQILALYRSGRQAEALQAYREARQTLVEGLGIEPSPALKELEKAILAQDVALDAVGEPRMPELPRGTVTLFFTDIEGSTRLERELRERYVEVLNQHQRLLRRAFEKYGGREIDTQGDSFFVAFPRASDAVSAAVEAQQALVSHSWPGGQQVRVRCGVHTGEASLSEGRYFGLAVHRAARISAAGHGGQILLSSSTRDVVADDLPPDQQLLDLGVYRLKDLPRPERVFQLVVDGLPSQFPPLRTREEQKLPEAARAALAPSRRQRVLRFVLLASLAAIPAVALALVLGRGGGDERSAAATPRVALVQPRAPSPREDNAEVDALRGAEREYGIKGDLLVANELNLDDPSVAKMVAQVRGGDYDLVVGDDGPLGSALGPTVQELEKTYFVNIGGPVNFPNGAPGWPNSTGILFANDQAGYLVGYLSGLMEARPGSRLKPGRIVSVIGGWRGVPGVEHLLDGFVRGARKALPGITVLTAYSRDFVDQSKCEKIANRQIDAGSDIVFAVAGVCSLGAMSAADIRGVWGVGMDADRSYLGSHILASAVLRWDQAVLIAIRSFLEGTLPAGGNITLGLNENAVGITGISSDVPESVRKQVAREELALKRRSPR